MRLFITSGIRKSELLSLNWGDVLFSDGLIDVLKGKGSKYRQVAVDNDTLRLLSRYLIQIMSNNPKWTGPNSPLIQTVDGKRLTDGGLRSMLKTITRRSGVKFSPQALRRTFARLSVKNGLDIVFIQQQMGHANVETTHHYIQDLDPKDLVKQYNEGVEKRVSREEKLHFATIYGGFR